MTFIPMASFTLHVVYKIQGVRNDVKYSVEDLLIADIKNYSITVTISLQGPFFLFSSDP